MSVALATDPLPDPKGSIQDSIPPTEHGSSLTVDVIEPGPVLPELTQLDLLEEAVAMRQIGAFDDAHRLLLKAKDLGGKVEEQVVYQQAVLEEVRENWDEAIAAHEVVTDRWPDSASADDSRFRRAYCLEEVGDHKAATSAVKQLQHRGDWDDDDSRTMLLQRGITELRSGKVRRGIRRILFALESGTDERTWIRAKARLALVRAQLDQASRIQFRGDKRAAKRLVKRANLLEDSEKQAIVMFNLNEPEFALEGLLLLGDGYVALYDALIAAPPPRKVKDTQAFVRAVEKRGKILLTKALARYDEGVRVAARTQWVGSVTQRLTEKRDALANQLGAEPESTP